MTSPWLQMGKLRLRETKWLAHGHTTRKWPNWDSQSDLQGQSNGTTTHQKKNKSEVLYKGDNPGPILQRMNPRLREMPPISWASTVNMYVSREGKHPPAPPCFPGPSVEPSPPSTWGLAWFSKQDMEAPDRKPPKDMTDGSGHSFSAAANPCSATLILSPERKALCGGAAQR